MTEILPTAEGAYADESLSPASNGEGVNGKAVDFLLLYGLSGLCEYVVERKAEKALPFLLALNRHLTMALRRWGRTSIPITKAVWRSAGNPSKNARQTIMAHIELMPELIILREKRTFASRYRVEKGPLWLQLEKDSREGRPCIDGGTVDDGGVEFE
jgi:hypothetical protein